ncbi:NUDIX domain-containing protein [Candidatus Obscuribacterales bacterium]|nr:NUDIX domain-containing protein [Candidatus Obscuribacterales bacterium]
MKDDDVTRIGVGVLVIRGDKYLLGKRIGAHEAGVYAAPGGHLEYGESFAECARREVLEETGLVAGAVRFLLIGNYMFGTKHYVDVDLVVECPDGEPIAMEPEKCAEWKWYRFDDLPSPVFIVTKRMIDAHLKGYNADTEAVENVLRPDA